MRKDGYQLKRMMKRELAKLNLDKAQRIMVEKCGDCPCWAAWAQKEKCSLGIWSVNYFRVPPHDCPLRTTALSVAIDPSV